MKYWSELNSLETQIIRLDMVRSLFSVLASGTDESSVEDIRNSLWYIEGSLSDIHNELRNEFDELWETVREEHFDNFDESAEKVKKKHKGGMKKKKQMTDRELP
jgi:predicted transcriptional regulator